jgi:Cof subfamily protein (haloacid dehalogenase superfamily)
VTFRYNLANRPHIPYIPYIPYIPPRNQDLDSASIVHDVRFRMVATDLDGTLLRNDESMSSRTKEAVHSVIGRVPFVIATGRPPRWVYPVAEDLGHHSVAVCSNGALTIDLNSKTILDSRLLDPTSALAAVRAIHSFLPGVGIAVDRLSGLSMDPAYVPSFAIPDDTRIAPIEQLLDEPAIKLLFRHASLDTAKLATIIEAIGDHALITYGAASGHQNFDRSVIDSSHPQSLSGTLIEVMALGVTKASALARICADRDIEAADVIAFGDMPNDIEMISWAGHGVAMANAHRSVKDVANEIALSNNEEGVARVLERELANARAGL